MAHHAPMVMDFNRRLRLVFTRRELSAQESPAVVEAPIPPPEVEFVAYGEDCALSGFTRLHADRLTDMLNQYEEYLLADVLVERLTDGEATEVAYFVFT